MENRGKITMKRTLLILTLVFIAGINLFAQQDSRYDSDKNLPFNQKAGDVDPQTGNVTLQVSDLVLQGRAGMNFSFGRIWKTNQSNIYTMSRNSVTGSNQLTMDTIEAQHNMGVGWSSTLPYILTDDSSGSRVVTLFIGGGAYEIDQNGVENNNPNNSNLLWYDLLDKRIYKDSSKAYSDGPVVLSTLSSDNVEQIDYRNEYKLLMKDNSSYLFRADGQLMMQADKTGLNEIWYYYDSQSRLAAVVDTVGRIIHFSYDANDNLSKIEWDVTSYIIAADGTRQTETETRSVVYTYKSTATYPAVSSIYDMVTDREISYELSTVTDPMGNVTEYGYDAKNSSFSFESNLSHWNNAYLLLTQIQSMVVGEEALMERRFEYDIPNDGMYTKYFYNGYMEYFKISREYAIDRNDREVGEKTYIYHDNNEAGNFSQYTTLIKAGNVTQTYTYSISSDPAKNEVLDTLVTETRDGFFEEIDFVYNNDRVKTLEETFRMGQFAFREQFLYDLKGNLKEFRDRMNMVTYTQYDNIYSMPIQQTQVFDSHGVLYEYDKAWEITTLGQVEKEIIYLNDNGSSRALTNRYEYDSYGNVVKITDPGNIETHMVYDSATHSLPVRSYQLVTEQYYSDSSSSNYWFEKPDMNRTVELNGWVVYNSDGSPWLEVDSEGFAIEHYYDKVGAEITTIYPDDNDYLFANSNVDEINTDGSFSAFLTSRQYNPGVRVEIDYANGFVKTRTDFEYNSGTQTWSTIVTGQQQDGVGNVEEEITYGAAEEIHAVKKMVYDRYGRMIALTDPDAGTAYSNITVNGERVQRFDKTWLVKYDDLGRTIKVLYPDTGVGTKVKVISYNDRENSTTTIDPEGSTLYAKMDWNGNVIEQIAYGNSSTSSSEVQQYYMEYDSLNRLVLSQDPEGLITEYRFDERNLLTEQIYGNGSDFMTYNDRGLLTNKSDRKGQNIEFYYDEAGRNIETRYIRTDSILEDTEYRQFDRRGNVIRVENNGIIEQCVFDGAGRISDLNRRVKNIVYRNSISSVYPGALEDQHFSFQYNYTASGLLNQMIYPDGSVHSFSYDQYLAQLESISEGVNEASLAPFVTNLDYNKSGVVTAMEYSNGTSQGWDFDNRKRISRIRISSAATPGEYLEDLNYTIDGSGNILSINDNQYRYDGFHRIVSASTRLPEVVDNRNLVEEYFGTYENGEAVEGRNYLTEADLFPTEGGDGRINGQDYLQALVDLEADTNIDGLPFDEEFFTYDRNGNRLTLNQNGDEFIYTYGIRNRLEKIYIKKVGTLSQELYAEYTYDANGNTSSRTIYGEEGTETVLFEYDVINRLIKTVRGSEFTEYVYDNAGNRVIKSSSDGSLHLYLRHGTISVAMDIEVNGDQTENKGEINRYLLSGDLLAGRITITIAADNSQSSERNYYHLDHLNSTKLVTDEAGIIVVNYTYRAFGEQLRRLDNSNNETDDLGKYSYGGKELDEDINLYYFNARFYDATTGRFINVDPIQDGTNWYVYCSNNPMSFVDPTGLEDTYISIWSNKLLNYYELNDQLVYTRNKFEKANKGRGFVMIVWGAAPYVSGLMSWANGHDMKEQDDILDSISVKMDSIEFAAYNYLITVEISLDDERKVLNEQILNCEWGSSEMMDLSAKRDEINSDLMAIDNMQNNLTSDFDYTDLAYVQEALLFLSEYDTEKWHEENPVDNYEAKDIDTTQFHYNN